MSPAAEPTVLILEDEPIARMHLEQQFRRNTSYTIETAEGGDEAIAVAERRPVDVLVADILMEGTDGVDAAERITARQDTVVIFVTASSDPGTRLRAEAVGPRAIWGKPVDVPALIELVTDAVEARRDPAEAELEPDFLLDTLYDTAAVGMCVTDENRRFVKVNRAYCDTYGYAKRELIGEPFTTVLPPEDRAAGGRLHDQFIAGTLRELPAEWRVRRKDGEIRNIYVTAGRMIAADGRPYKVTTVTDVTLWKKRDEELAAALAEKDVLLREVHHRVKNNLNTLSSMLNLQLEQHRDDGRIAEILTVSVNRIKTMSAIYERLHRRGSASVVDAAVYLETLARDLVSTLPAAENATLDLDIAAHDVDIDTGIALGLIVNELVTNSMKHAVGAGGGSIHLRTQMAEGTYFIEVWDDGPGLPGGFDIGASNTLGLQLMQAVTAQRGGRIELVEPGSAHLRVTVPIE